MTKEHDLLIKEASRLIPCVRLTDECIIKEVGCALMTDKGKVYTGVSIAGASIGFCAEQSAIAEMLKSGESKIKAIVAVATIRKTVRPIPPCGQCREFMYQINRKNLKTKVIIAKNKVITLDKLLTHRWQDLW